jgi:hypothetical protein
MADADSDERFTTERLESERGSPVRHKADRAMRGEDSRTALHFLATRRFFLSVKALVPEGLGRSAESAVSKEVKCYAGRRR